ncbi:uncharacterized protein Aud_002784 [Aspergillus udagawae]|uniref:ABM domain-containing protein n=1 Tax=Aspergillus udagawae TaxID=91492 RepID=A0A8E0UWG2_9EURO|nr:uncharacterized protein Aud_002784 [Aspergillus udagawae]GIC86413.1 hypothetical protein Aud_002784 [Aspergillus udagawae]
MSPAQITVWTEFQVPHGEELNITEWNQLFQPLVQAAGHVESVWARILERPDIVLLASLWKTASALRGFTASLSAQLHWESLAARAIVPLGSHEFDPRGHIPVWFDYLRSSYVQLFWVYLPAPVTRDKQSEILQLPGIVPAAFGPGVPRTMLFQKRRPMQIWAHETETLHGKEVQLMLWPHFWQSAEKAKIYRDFHIDIIVHHVVVGRRTITEDFQAKLEALGPTEWREGHCGSSGGGGGSGSGSGSSEGDNEDCSTQTARVCSTACIAGSGCDFACSTTTGCSETPSSSKTVGTPPPGVGVTLEQWPVMTDNPAAFESIASSLDSVLSSLYGPLTVFDETTTEPTTTTTSPATVTSDGPHFWVYAYWEADCSGMSDKTEWFGSRSIGLCYLDW